MEGSLASTSQEERTGQLAEYSNPLIIVNPDILHVGQSPNAWTQAYKLWTGKRLSVGCIAWENGVRNKSFRLYPAQKSQKYRRTA